jgi:hypothetical protein
MDPLSITVSVTTLLSLAGSLVSFGYIYGSTIRDAQKEVRAITEEATQLSGLLHSIQSILDDAAPSNESFLVQSQPPHALPKLRPSVLSGDDMRACEQTLREIAMFMSKASPEGGKFWKNTVNRLQWPIKKDSLQALLVRLERNKATVSLSLSAHGTYAAYVSYMAKL